jgi:hypothetical protein
MADKIKSDIKINVYLSNYEGFKSLKIIKQ